MSSCNPFVYTDNRNLSGHLYSWILMGFLCKGNAREGQSFISGCANPILLSPARVCLFFHHTCFVGFVDCIFSSAHVLSHSPMYVCLQPCVYLLKMYRILNTMPNDGDTESKKILDPKGFWRQLQDMIICAIHVLIHSTSDS